MRAELMAGQQALKLMLIFTLLSGIYTLALTGLAQLAFPVQAAGSLLWSPDHAVLYGSRLMGQPSRSDRHLWGRAAAWQAGPFRDADGTLLLYGRSAAVPVTGAAYAQQVSARVAEVWAAHPEMGGQPVPVDLVTASGSGLDPDISPAAAAYQVQRLARTTGRSEAEIRSLIAACTEKRFLGLFGEPRVNVLAVNLQLDGIVVR